MPNFVNISRQIIKFAIQGLDFDQWQFSIAKKVRHW